MLNDSGIVYPEDVPAKPHFAGISETFVVSHSELLRRVNSEGAIKVGNCACIPVIHGVQTSRGLKVDTFVISRVPQNTVSSLRFEFQFSRADLIRHLLRIVSTRSKNWSKYAGELDVLGNATSQE